MLSPLPALLPPKGFGAAEDAPSLTRAASMFVRRPGMRRINDLLIYFVNSQETKLSCQSETTMRRSTILLVEDDPLLRADTMVTLEGAGLTVIDRADADEALGVLLENSTDIAAVFTDINMPGHSDGVHLAEMISRHWPHIGVLVTSGQNQPSNLPDRVHFIPKPWRIEQIVAAMQDLVEAA
jgi:CheY-like chemotaxis protein